MENKSYRDRKPDLETERFRMWKADKSDKNIKEDINEKHKIFVDIGNKTKMQLCGFTKAIDKKSKEVMFAYKFKHEDKMVLYYINEKFCNDKKMEEVKNELFGMMKLMGYVLQDTKDMIKDIQNEKHLIKKL